MSLSFLFAKQEKPLVDTLPMENVKYGLLGVNPYSQPDHKLYIFWTTSHIKKKNKVLLNSQQRLK